MYFVVSFDSCRVGQHRHKAISVAIVEHQRQANRKRDVQRMRRRHPHARHRLHRPGLYTPRTPDRHLLTIHVLHTKHKSTQRVDQRNNFLHMQVIPLPSECLIWIHLDGDNDRAKRSLCLMTFRIHDVAGTICRQWLDIEIKRFPYLDRRLTLARRAFRVNDLTMTTTVCALDMHLMYHART